MCIWTAANQPGAVTARGCHVCYAVHDDTIVMRGPDIFEGLRMRKTSYDILFYTLKYSTSLYSAMGAAHCYLAVPAEA